MFTPRVRRGDVPYDVYFMAMRMVRKFKHLQLQPMDVLKGIRERGFTHARFQTLFNIFADEPKGAAYWLDSCGPEEVEERHEGGSGDTAAQPPA